MIKLEKGQLLEAYDDICVMNTGEYQDTDLVDFCYVSAPETSVFQFQADFVKAHLREM